MPSVNSPAYELVVADGSVPELREQCLKVRYAGTTRILWQAAVLASPYPSIRFNSDLEM